MPDFEMSDYEMLNELTQDDMKFFEELTGEKLEDSGDGRLLASMRDEAVLCDDGIFRYEFSVDGADMWAWDIIGAVVLLAHSIPRRDLMEMLR